MYVAGEAGTEWIAPNWMVSNPVTAPIISSLESFRQNPVKLDSNIIPMFASGGYASSSLSSKMDTLNEFDNYRFDFMGVVGAKVDKLQDEILTELVSRIGNSLDENTKAIHGLINKKTYVAIEDIKIGEKKYLEIKTHSGL